MTVKVKGRLIEFVYDTKSPITWISTSEILYNNIMVQKPEKQRQDVNKTEVKSSERPR